MLRLEDKKAIVQEIVKVATASNVAVVAEYRGLTVSQITKLRSHARQVGVYIRVIRNTLARRALANTRFSCLQKMLVGPLVFCFSQDEPSIMGRLIRDFVKDNEKLVVKALSVEGKLLSPQDIEFLANLPTREQALGMLLRVMKAPISQFVSTVREPYAKLVRTFGAVCEQKNASI